MRKTKKKAVFSKKRATKLRELILRVITKEIIERK